MMKTARRTAPRLARRHPVRTQTARTLPALAVALALASCAVGPNYHRTDAPSTPEFKENQGWKPASPSQIPTDQPWWSIYHDATLDGLERQVVISNQTLKSDIAAYYSAVQQIAVDRGQLLPSLSVSGSATKSNGRVNTTGFTLGSVSGSSTIYTAGPTGSWVLDVWGRIRRTVESDADKAQVSAADVAAALLSAQMTLAEDYFQLRAAEDQSHLYESYIADLQEALRITRNEVAAGTTTLADVYAAETQVETTQAAQINVQLTRETQEHAIAVLVGKPPAAVTVPAGPFATDVPVVPAGMPSALLERRPDIAAAERSMASANALIGVAVSAWFPTLTLNGTFEFSATALRLLSAKNGLWSFGPTIEEDVFNGGSTLAGVRQARANYDQTVASYRQTVLSAFQSVENDISSLRVLEQSQTLQELGVKDSLQSEALTLNQYKAGIVPYSSVITAQTTRIAAQITLSQIRSQRLVSSADLVGQLGGGWDQSQLKLRNDGVPPGSR
jgi:NodT family efflux transporter outer membrane factor (OMF) lipoprotein